MMRNYLQKKKLHLLSILIIFLLFLGYNNQIVSNPGAALTDWLDYPLLVYIQHLSIIKFAQLDFSSFGNTTMFHFTPNSLYFSDLLLPQSLIGLFFYVFVKDFILIHNLTFFVVGLLNIIALYYFWNKVFENRVVVGLITLLFTFSPYVFGMYYHYQMLSYFPFFFSLGLLLSTKSKKSIFASGILAGIQFLASAYLGIFLATTTLIWFAWKTYYFKKVKHTIKESLIFFIGFLLTSGYFLVNFIQTKLDHNISRAADQYVNSAFQITDLAFNPYDSLWVISFFHKINVHNHRLGDETFSFGFVLLIALILSLVVFLKKKKSKKEKFYSGFFMLLAIWGLTAALGPRLTINGKYLAIPLPYILPLKLTPVFDAITATARWFFLFQIGLFYFLGKGVEHLLKHQSKTVVVILILVFTTIYTIEIVPIETRTSVQNYKQPAYTYLQTNCNENQVLLEYPFAPQQPKTHVHTTLSYWTKMLLNNMYYDCQLINGYSGYQPQHITQYYERFNTAFSNKNYENIMNLLEEKDVTYIKFNKSFLLPSSIENIREIIESKNFDVIYNDTTAIVILINYQ